MPAESTPTTPIKGFNVVELFGALDRKRIAESLSWSDVTRRLWEQSEVLNAERDDHPIAVNYHANH